MATPYVAVLVTVPNKKTAQKLAAAIVQRRLAACVNVVSGVESHYYWENKLERQPELLLIVKTRAALIPELTTFVRENHPYTVPEVVALPVLAGNPAYLDWLGANTLFQPEPEELQVKK